MDILHINEIYENVCEEVTIRNIQAENEDSIDESKELNIQVLIKLINLAK